MVQYVDPTICGNWNPPTPEEIARARAIIAEKHRPENIVLASDVPAAYRPWISKEEVSKKDPDEGENLT